MLSATSDAGGSLLSATASTTVPAQPCRAVPPSRSRGTPYPPTRTRAPAGCSRLVAGCSSATFTDSRRDRDHGPSSIRSAGPRSRAPLDPGSRLCDGRTPKMGKWKNGSSLRRPQVSPKSVRDWGPGLTGAVVAGSMFLGPGKTRKSILSLPNPKIPSPRAFQAGLH